MVVLCIVGCLFLLENVGVLSLMVIKNTSIVIDVSGNHA